MSGAPITLCRLARRTPRATLRLAAFHATLLRHSRGRADRWFGSRLLLLETIGRASGLTRHAAVVYLPDGDDLVGVPANAGAGRPPAWWLDLRHAGCELPVVVLRRALA